VGRPGWRAGGLTVVRLSGYTLFLPSFEVPCLLGPTSFPGAVRIALLRPQALLGLDGHRPPGPCRRLERGANLLTFNHGLRSHPADAA
jgi:hypothetical protein